MPGEFAAPGTASDEAAGAVDIHTRTLRSFLAMAEDLHFTHAATRLRLTQQALSHQIKGLEREIGAQLFERTTRRVALTPAGEAFHRRIAAFVAGLDEAVARAVRSDKMSRTDQI